MKTIFFIFFIFFEIAFCPIALYPQGLAGSGGAMVTEDSLPVYSANSPKSDILKVLKKGDLVWVQIEISGVEDTWCLISEKGKQEPLGFVLCKNLQSLPPESPKPVEKGEDSPIPRDDSGAQPAGLEDQAVPSYSFQIGGLLQAIWNEDISAVKELLEKGVNPNAQTVMGTSPLHGAVKKDEAEITRLLIAHGANINARDQNGLTPLMAAASVGQTQNIEALLAAGARIEDKDDKGFTALMWAVIQGSQQGVEVLLEHKAEVNARSKEGRTALWLSKQALSNTRKSLATAFRKNSEESIRDLKGKLANQEEIFQMLQEAGGKE